MEQGHARCLTVPRRNRIEYQDIEGTSFTVNVTEYSDDGASGTIVVTAKSNCNPPKTAVIESGSFTTVFQ